MRKNNTYVLLVTLYFLRLPVSPRRELFLRQAASAACRQQTLDIFSQQVGFDIQPISHSTLSQRGLGQRVWNERDGDTRLFQVRDGQTDAVERDRAVGNDIAQQFAAKLDDHELA